MTMEECPSFHRCSAPLCPLHLHLATQVWYPSEEVCRRQWGGNSPPWLLKQRRLARRCQHHHTYFTLEMLLATNWVNSKIKGIDPNSKQSPEAWIKERTRDRHSTRFSSPISQDLDTTHNS